MLTNLYRNQFFFIFASDSYDGGLSSYGGGFGAEGSDVFLEMDWSSLVLRPDVRLDVNLDL